jgi:hypothetical protein
MTYFPFRERELNGVKNPMRNVVLSKRLPPNLVPSPAQGQNKKETWTVDTDGHGKRL